MQPYDGTNENFVMQMSFMRMQMRMCMLVMYGFAPAWVCRRKCSQMMMQMKISCFVNVFQEDAYANVMHVMQMFEPTLMVSSKIHYSILVQKQVILFNLEFQ